MAFQIINITDDPDQRHLLLVGDDEITFRMRFHQVSEFWTFDVSWQGETYNGFMISLGCLHIQSLNWPFDFFCLTTDGSGIAPFRIGDFSEGRCEMYIALQEEIEAPTSTTAMYPVINVPAYTGPSLLADFVGGVYKSGEAGSTPQTKAFPNVVSLTRSTTATYVNSAGLIVTADVDSPRFEYNPLTGVARGLKIEPSRTNLSINSDSFTAGTGVTPMPDTAVAPDGFMTADSIIENTANTEHYANDISLSPTIGVAYTWSVFAKRVAGTRNILVRVAGGNVATAVFNFDTKTFTTGGAQFVTADYEEYPGGWFRVWVVMTAASAASTVFRLQLTSGVTTVYLGDGVASLAMWRRQLEVGNVPSSSIQTTTVAVTRAADVVLMPNGPWRTTPDGTLTSDADAGVTVALTTPGISVSGIGHVRNASYTPNA